MCTTAAMWTNKETLIPIYKTHSLKSYIDYITSEIHSLDLPFDFVDADWTPEQRSQWLASNANGNVILTLLTC